MSHKHRCNNILERPGTSASHAMVMNMMADRQHRVQQYKTAGNEKFNENNFKGAITDYRAGLALDSTNADLHLNLAAAYLHVQKYVEASEHAVYGTHLKPSFYKGYLRAAKADHAKYMTRHAIKHLERGLRNVSDPNGIKELAKLKNQYTAYMSLKSNADREMELESDSSDDEDAYYDNNYSDESDDGPFDDAPPLCCALCAENKQSDNDLPPMPKLVPASTMLYRCIEPLDIKEESEKQRINQTIDFMKSFEVVFDNDDEGVSSSKIEKNDCKTDNLKGDAKLDGECDHEGQTPDKDLNIENKTATLPVVQSNCKNKSYGNKEVELPTTAEEPSTPWDQTIHVPLERKNMNNIPLKNPDSCLENSKEIASDQDLKMLISEFNDHLKRGSEAFSARNYRRAADSFRIAEERVSNNLSEFEMDIRQLQIIRYAYATALINLDSYDDIVKGLQALQKIEEYKCSIPAIYAQMTQAYCKLNRFKAALVPLTQLHKVLEDCPIFPTFTWPGTNETIEETTPSGLKKYIGELNVLCNMSHKATAVCRYDNCYKTSSHIVPSELIFDSDPDFIGYVRMTCEDKCSIEFHIPCWKAFKESTTSGVGKINDKDLLGRRCLTTDCVSSTGEPSVVILIEIIGTDRKVKSSNRLDPKTAAISRKRKMKSDDAEKLKDKEKERASRRKKIYEKKVQDMKKSAASMDDELDIFEEKPVPIIDPMTALAKRKEAIIQLREVIFGLGDKRWNPKSTCYGRPGETIKSSDNKFLDNITDSAEVVDAKEFLFSYFMTMLRDEGPLKMTEIEEQWTESAGGFCDMSIVLPNLRNMCDLLLESTVFCQLEDYICLSDQLEELYEQVKNDTADVVTFLMNGIPDTGTSPKAEPHQHQGASNQCVSLSSSDAEDDSANEDSELTDEECEDESEVEGGNCKDSLSEVLLKSVKTSNSNGISFNDILNEMTKVKSIIMNYPEDNGIIYNEQLSAEDDKSFSNTHSTKVAVETVPAENTSDLDSPGSSYDEHNSNEDNTSDEDDFVRNCGIDSTTADWKLQMLSDVAINNFNIGASTIQNNAHIKTGRGEAFFEHKTISNNSCEKVTEGSEIGLYDQHKASQCEPVVTKDGEMQTSHTETKDRVAQTTDSDCYKELVKELELLTSKLASKESEIIKLEKVQKEKDVMINTMKDSAANIQKKYDLACTILKNDMQKKELESLQKLADSEKRENLQRNLAEKVNSENAKLKKEISALSTNQEKLQKSLEMAKTRIRELENKTNSLEVTARNKCMASQKKQLGIIKVYWENQINMLRRHCVEKISEMQNWFSMFPAEEVEDLPSWGSIRQNTMQWSEISTTIHQIEAVFQATYISLESRIEKGEELRDLSISILPTLPEEPTPLPLDKIHKEITEKHLKKIADLSQLVVNQQFEIEKNKEANVKIQQLVNSFQPSPSQRTQSPMTTAFGSLALKYPYPQYGQPPVSKVPPSAQDTPNVGSGGNMLQTDVQTLLKDSATAGGHHLPAPKSYEPLEMGGLPPAFQIPFPNLFSTPPPLHMPPPSASQTNTMPPSIGVAQNLLKTSSAISNKKDPVPTSFAKQEPAKACSSRESTPVASPFTNSTPEKSKKKKKNKSESNENSELKTAAGNSTTGKGNISMAPCYAEDLVSDTADWNVVLPKSAIVKQPIALTPAPESKLKNKKKLLDKLQLKFPNTTVKDLDDIVKLVREQNNGSLSGLPFTEIESRVERVVIKNKFNKSSPYGLAKLSSSVWGTIKPQEKVVCSDLQVDECTICLDSLGSEKTKIECNHEFHTKCLRKWLKEKRVCPLCNKFTTMPDEFPAL